MSDLVGIIQSGMNSSCHVNSCSKNGCTVGLGRVSIQHVILDFDEQGSPLSPQDIRCDYLFVANGNNNQPGWVAPLELTSGRSKTVKKATTQLQVGARIAEGCIPANVEVNFRPVLVGRLKPTQKSMPRKREAKIRFHDQEEVIRRINCGDSLCKALK